MSLSRLDRPAFTHCSTFRVRAGLCTMRDWLFLVPHPSFRSRKRNDVERQKRRTSRVPPKRDHSQPASQQTNTTHKTRTTLLCHIPPLPDRKENTHREIEDSRGRAQMIRYVVVRSLQGGRKKDFAQMIGGGYHCTTAVVCRVRKVMVHIVRGKGESR